MYNLGVLPANQWDPLELDQARIWWEKAADAGTTSAMYNLGLLLANQWDPPQLEQPAPGTRRPPMAANRWDFGRLVSDDVVRPRCRRPSNGGSELLIFVPQERVIATCRRPAAPGASKKRMHVSKRRNRVFN
jgi:hypothetical protein